MSVKTSPAWKDKAAQVWNIYVKPRLRATIVENMLKQLWKKAIVPLMLADMVQRLQALKAHFSQ